MAIERRYGGLSGKECVVCKEWKILGEFPVEKRRGRNMKFQSARCSKCTAIEKAQEKKNRAAMTAQPKDSGKIQKNTP